ncbi:MAG: hypothetical protein RI957_1490 [Verrucomicrobiota bacterium]|jgi:hypothetical protein
MQLRDHLTKVFSQALFFVLLTAPVTHARTWTSADGKSTFVGDLIAYNAATHEVTVDRAGKRVTFKEHVLSESDIAFLKNTSAPTLHTPKPVEAVTAKPPTSIPVNQTALLGNGRPDYTFKPAPFDKGKPWLIRNFGPVGIGIMLEKGPVMKIQNIEAGSPAEKAGNLKQGDIIESINGVKLTETKRDPRLVLGDLITEAEATDGKINLQLKDKGIVTVIIPVLGRYSETWPLNCPKSDKIVRNLADLIAKQGKTEWGSILFLLSTGEEKDLDVVRGWMKERKATWAHNWSVGIEGMGICEYYLRTGDATALPIIQKGADHLRDRIYNGGWSGRAASFNYQSGGHLNAAGVHCVTFLMLAKTCGVNVDEKTFQTSLSHFFDYSGKGSVPYGDYVPKPGFSDCNGKTGGLALAMAAAARLTPNGEKSVYAKAAHTNAIKAYYGTHSYNMGHTGGGIGEIWKSAGVGLLAEKRQNQYRDYMNARRWTLELSRRHNGAMGIAGGEEGNYDQASGEKPIAWGTLYALNYTLPRKHLHLFGAPLSKWAKSCQLPERPVGSNSADDDFNSPFPVPGGPWSDEHIFKETLMLHGGASIGAQLSSDQVTDETIRTYLHHPEITHRFDAMGIVLKLKKDDMILELLRSKDARLRHVGIMAVHELLGTWRASSEEQKRRATPEIMSAVDQIIRNPDESGFVRGWAAGLLKHANTERLRTFRPLLAELMGKEPTQVAAIHASMPLLTDTESYQIIFPPMMKAISTATSYAVSMSATGMISKAMEQASPEIKEYGLKQLKNLYGEQPKDLVSSDTGIYIIPDGATAKRRAIGQSLAFTPEGLEFMKLMPKTTLKSYISGKDSDMFSFSGKFEIDKKYVGGTWIWVTSTHPPRLGDIDTIVKKWIKDRKGNVAPFDAKDTVEFREDGTVQKSSLYGGKHKGQYYWTGHTVFGVNTGEACKMEIRMIDGYEFMVIENGNFAPVIPKEGEAEATVITPDYHCGYTVYMRKPQ